MLTHLNWMAHQINHSLLILKRWGSLSAYIVPSAELNLFQFPNDYLLHFLEVEDEYVCPFKNHPKKFLIDIQQQLSFPFPYRHPGHHL